MELKFNWEGNRDRVQKLTEFIKENKSKKGILMMALHETQDLFGYIPLEIMELVSKELKIPLSEIYGVLLSILSSHWFQREKM